MEKSDRAFMMLLAVVGLGLIVSYANWQTALGVFLLAYSHNIERHMRRDAAPPSKEQQ